MAAIVGAGFVREAALQTKQPGASLRSRRRPRLRTAQSGMTLWSRAGRREGTYLRAAHAYMLISMPTGTSTIFGVFQVIRELQVRGTVAA